jgi:hypothetical protein
MQSSGIWRRVGLVKDDVSEERVTPSSRYKKNRFL